MDNLKLVTSTKFEDLNSLLELEINENCFRKVDKRLALKMAKALLRDAPGEANIFYAQRLASVLKTRLDERARVTECFM